MGVQIIDLFHALLIQMIFLDGLIYGGRLKTPNQILQQYALVIICFLN